MLIWEAAKVWFSKVWFSFNDPFTKFYPPCSFWRNHVCFFCFEQCFCDLLPRCFLFTARLGFHLWSVHLCSVEREQRPAVWLLVWHLWPQENKGNTIWRMALVPFIFIYLDPYIFFFFLFLDNNNTKEWNSRGDSLFPVSLPLWRRTHICWAESQCVAIWWSIRTHTRRTSSGQCVGCNCCWTRITLFVDCSLVLEGVIRYVSLSNVCSLSFNRLLGGLWGVV